MDARRRLRYREAERKLGLQGNKVTKRQSHCKAFVKREAIEMKADKVNPDCRMIQYRDPVYCLKLASIIKNAEHALYRAKGLKLFPKTRFIAKNMNNHQRAAILRQKFDSIPGCKVLELDASRFDAHVNQTLLSIEHSVWRGTCAGDQLDQLLDWQLVNNGAFRVGGFKQRYQVRGGRMSGDANTAAGNCIIMACMLASFGAELGVKFDFICDGDDSVFFYQGEDIPESRVMDFFEKYGMTMKIEARPKSFEEICFCQGKPHFIAGKWVMVRDPKKVISRWNTNWKYAREDERVRRVRTLALGELSLNKGVPMLQPLFVKLLEACERKEPGGRLMESHILEEYRYSSMLSKGWREGATLPVTTEVRKAFSAAWGISINQQQAFERRLAQWEPSFIGNEDAGEVTIGTWGIFERNPEVDRMGSVF